MRIAIGLATAVLCSIPLYNSGISQAAPSTGSTGAKCFSYKATGVSSAVCDYAFGQPFLLKGFSRGGASTLSYTVRCGNDPSWPTRKAAIDRRIWYKRSFSVRGDFQIYGAKGTLSASRHCVATRGRTALLSVTLKMSKGATRTNLIVRLDTNLTWGEYGPTDLLGPSDGSTASFTPAGMPRVNPR